jgi:competence protein ComEC
VNFFANNPFTKILSFWLAGLLAAFYIPWSVVVFTIGWALIGVMVLKLIKTKAYPFDLYFSVFLATCFMLMAFLTATKKEVEHPTNNQVHHFLATVLEHPGEKPKSLQSLLKIDCCDSIFFNNQKVMVYFEKNETARQLQPGDQIMVKNQLQRIQNSDEPFAFDYQKFMANREIFYSCYLPSRNFTKIESSKPPSIIIRAEKFRANLIKLLKTHIKYDESVQVISALTLGYRKELTEETRSYFASTGAMHVLAVSGLHVGMIYLFLSTVFAFLKRGRFGNFLFLAIIAGILWFYALLTGFSPSVQRATVMFTFILIGNSINRTASIYNSIAASAFILLLFNPKLIHEVGFQLSYSAVISIVFFFPRLETFFSPKNKALKWMWQLLCVSVSAQLGVSALSVYYFHQFPSYFWLSNFLVVPAAYFILAFTFLLFVFSPLGWTAAIISKLLSAITFFTIFFLRKIDGLPFALTENVSVSAIQLFCLMGLFVGLIFFIKLKEKNYFFLIMGFVLLVLLSSLIEKAHYFNQKKIIYYARTKQVQLVNGRKNYLICRNMEEGQDPKKLVANRKLKLESPIVICLDSCQNYESEDLIIDNNTIHFLNNSFQFEDYKVNQRYQRNKTECQTVQAPDDSDHKKQAGTPNPIAELGNLTDASSFVVDL